MDAMEPGRAEEPEPVEDFGEAEPALVQEAEVEEPGFIGAHLAVVLRVAGGIGVALVIIGTVLAVTTQGRLPTVTVDIGSLPESLLRLDPDAILTLGIMMFVAAPAFGVAYLVQAFLRIHDRLYAAIAAVVLLILVSSVLITLGLRGV
jgi:uncharacterized membrane protein